VIFAAPSQASSACTARSLRPCGIALAQPVPAWSVFEQPDGDDKALRVSSQVDDVERNEFGPAQRAGEADQDQRAIAQTCQIRGDAAQSLGEQVAVSAAFFAGGAPRVRAMQASVALTPACAAGLS